jgi:hypothetical protein
MALPTFSARNVSVAWGGVVMSGLAAESFVTFTPNGDVMESESGSDGKHSRSLLPDFGGKIEVGFQPSSPFVAFLAGVIAKTRSEGILYSKTFIVFDPSGSVVARGKAATVMSMDSIELGSSQNGKVTKFTFDCEELELGSIPFGVDEIDLDPSIPAAIATITSLS